MNFTESVTRLKPLGTDRQHGASELSRRAIAILTNSIAPQWREQTTARRAASLMRVASTLERIQPAMGSFRRWAIDLRALATVHSSSLASDLFGRWCRWWGAQLAREDAGVGPSVLRDFPPRATVVTISRSEYVLSAIIRLQESRRPRRVIALRSWPGGEGAGTARVLRRHGVHAEIVDDRLGLGAVQSADLLLIGADAVLRDGSVVHKVGTRALAEVARESRVRTWSLAGHSKFTNLDAEELGPLPPLFDVTPGGDVSRLGTEAGFVRPSDVRRMDFGEAIRYATRPAVRTHSGGVRSRKNPSVRPRSSRS